MDLEAFKEIDGAGGVFWAAWRVANDVGRCELRQTATVFQCQSAAEAWLREALYTAVEVIERRWDEVLSVAEALRGQGRLDADGFKKAVDPELFLVPKPLGHPEEAV